MLLRRVGLPVQLGARRVAGLPVLARPASVLVRSSNGAKETTTVVTTSDDEGTGNLAGEYCAIDSTGKRLKKRTVGEMEQEFLEALSSFYYEGRPKLSDEEFEVLKEVGLREGRGPVLHVASDGRARAPVQWDDPNRGWALVQAN